MSGHSPRTSSAREPCLGCGEETAVGSIFFSDRHTVEHSDGTRAYLCTLCDARIRSSRKGMRLTDEEVRDIVENGSWPVERVEVLRRWTEGGCQP